jgi:hypothetical protein
MNQLFNCKNIKWNGSEYEEFPDQTLDVFEEEEEEELE